MWTSPTVTTTGIAFTVVNPSLAKTSSIAVSVQVANASPWILNVQTLYGSVAVQPFEASTLPAPVTNLFVTPGLQLYPFASGTVTVAWMLDGEEPPQPDGPLTAAATIAAITGTITTQQSGRVVGSASFSGSGTATISGFLPSDQWCTLIPSNSGAINSNPTIIDNVQGSTSNITYHNQDILAGATIVSGIAFNGQWRIGFPIFGALDTSLIITSAGTGTYGLTAIASPYPVPPMENPIQHMQLTGVTGSTAYTLNPIGATYARILGAFLFVNNTAANVVLQAHNPWIGGTIRVAEAWGLTLVGEYNPSMVMAGGQGLIVQTPITLETGTATADGLVDYQTIA